MINQKFVLILKIILIFYNFFIIIKIMFTFFYTYIIYFCTILGQPHLFCTMLTQSHVSSGSKSSPHMQPFRILPNSDSSGFGFDTYRESRCLGGAATTTSEDHTTKRRLSLWGRLIRIQKQKGEKVEDERCPASALCGWDRRWSASVHAT